MGAVKWNPREIGGRGNLLTYAAHCKDHTIPLSVRGASLNDLVPFDLPPIIALVYHLWFPSCHEDKLIVRDAPLDPAW